jgi:hypothetical protein
MRVLRDWLGWLCCESAFALFDRGRERVGNPLYRLGCWLYA